LSTQYAILVLLIVHAASIAALFAHRRRAASIAREIARPLGTILRNVEAAERLLRDPRTSAATFAHLLSDIKRDNLRAAAIARRWLDAARGSRD
jgi:signal transduction histidine kinase